MSLLMSIPAQATTSTVVLVNTEVAEAHATVDFLEADGRITSTTEKTIAAQGLAVITVPATSLQGSARVLADRRVEAIVVNANDKGSIRDSYEAVLPSTMASFPLFQRPDASNKSVFITVLSTDTTETTNVTLRYYDERGVARGTRTVTLQPLASHNFDIVRASGKKKRGLTATLESTSPVVAAEHVATAGSDGTSLKAVAQSDECTSCTLGLIKFGTSDKSLQWTEIYIQNRGTTKARVSLNYRNSKGASTMKQTRTIPAQGFTRFDTRQGAQKRGGDFVGYATITQTGEGQPLAVQWLIQGKGRTRHMGFNALNSTAGSRLWMCVDTTGTAGLKQHRVERLAITNTSGATAQGTVEFYDASSGERLHQQPLRLASKGFTEINLNAKLSQGANIGFALVRADTNTPLIVNAYSEDSGGASGHTCQPLS
jgi:hypothetical protein